MYFTLIPLHTTTATAELYVFFNGKFSNNNVLTSSRVTVNILI